MDRVVCSMSDHYPITTILKAGTWTIEAANYKPSIIEYPTVLFTEAENFRRCIYVTQQSLKRHEKAFGRKDSDDADAFYLYISSSNRTDLMRTIEFIREILITGSTADYNAFWIDQMAMAMEKGKWVADGVIRGENVGNVRSIS